jgi:hypothetical protein
MITLLKVNETMAAAVGVVDPGSLARWASVNRSFRKDVDSGEVLTPQSPEKIDYNSFLRACREPIRLASILPMASENPANEDL